jgi:predicted nucleic acid-binding protein
MGPDGSVTLIELDAPRALARARALCEAHRLRALDAIHLAVALAERDELGGEGELVFVTRDADQAAAARAEGLAVA